ncbi:hypothetical protein QBC46DRAFT_380678 [Diplogelasinospora grovesii]|uniref:IQ calmodulin-binding motif protein n=1 Tax=Diplogelasinospora grovesii TaxID=303347 RepID=A0AAN6NB14_9PEZI|nr:hypothetical protein QBC46DRAFT_380678 [Diplogelasinospora grovesii]
MAPAHHLPKPPTANFEASLNTVQSTKSHKEYLDSLVPPSKEELHRIAEVQTEREAELKRRSHESKRRSLDVASRPHTQPQTQAPKDPQTQAQQNGEQQHGSQENKQSSHHCHISERLGLAHHSNPSDDGLRAKAATLIQRAYRGYRARRQMKGLGIDATTRWIYAIREAQWRELTRPRARSELADGLGGGKDAYGHLPSADGNNDMQATRSSAARQKWKKVAVIARRAGGDLDEDDSASTSSSSSSSSSASSSSHSDNEGKPSELEKQAAQRRGEAKERRRKTAKTMGLQYFLEMVDLKHRYGSNLRTYHNEWKKSDTKENFFYWLDYGSGRFVDIASCPRERLDREQVRYLSREERQYYLVTVDAQGRLCWAKNGVRIDTTEKWKDSIHGIVPADDPTPAFQGVQPNGRIGTPQTGLLGDSTISPLHSHSDESSSDESSPDEDEEEAARAAKYATPGLDSSHGIKKIRHVSAGAIFNKLLRKTVRKNTWIFVADTSFRLYVGIKNTGAFQHSSFLQGSRISAAGLIKIKNGRLSSLSPLSGHYRPPASNFRAFVHSLRDAGVDMSHVSISKSYAVLVGLEAYVKTRRKGKKFLNKMVHAGDHIIHPHECERQKEEEQDTGESAAKERQTLKKEEEEEEMRDQNKASVQVLQKLGINPAEPAGQKGGDAEAG